MTSFRRSAFVDFLLLEPDPGPDVWDGLQPSSSKSQFWKANTSFTQNAQSGFDSFLDTKGYVGHEIQAPSMVSALLFGTGLAAVGAGAYFFTRPPPAEATGATGATGALTASHGSQMTAILHQEARRHHFAEGAKMGPHRRPGSGGTKRGIMTQPETVALCCICWSVKTGTEHLLVANWWRVRKTTQNLAMPCKAGKAWKAKRSNKWFSTRPSFSEEETKRSNRSSKLTRVGMYSANLTPADTRNVWKINALWELG